MKHKIGNFTIGISDKCKNALYVAHNKKIKMLIHDKGIIISNDHVNIQRSDIPLEIQSKNSGMTIPIIKNINKKKSKIGTIIYNSDLDTFMGLTRTRGWVELSANLYGSSVSKISQICEDEKRFIKPISGIIIYNITKNCVEIFKRGKWINIC